jgi:hypothetical protein
MAWRGWVLQGVQDGMQGLVAMHCVESSTVCVLSWTDSTASVQVTLQVAASSDFLRANIIG